MLFLYLNFISDTELSVKSPPSLNQFNISSSLAEINLVKANYHHDKVAGRPVWAAVATKNTKTVKWYKLERFGLAVRDETA